MNQKQMLRRYIQQKKHTGASAIMSFNEAIKWGLTLDSYCNDFHFSRELLESNFVGECIRQSKKVCANGRYINYPSVTLNYINPQSDFRRCRYRMSIEPVKRFSPYKWDAQQYGIFFLYGLWRLQPCFKRTILVLPTEEDAHAIWHIANNKDVCFDAVSIPNCYDYYPERDDQILSQFDKIFVFVENNFNGQILMDRINGKSGYMPSSLLEKISFFSLRDYNSISEAWKVKYWQTPDKFYNLINNSTKNNFNVR